MKTFSRRLEDVLKKSSVQLFFVFQDVFKTYLQDVFLKTSWRLLEDILKKTCYRYVMNTSWKRLKDFPQRHFEDVLKTSWWCLWKRSCKHILKTSWSRLEDVLQDEKLLRWRHLQEVLKTSWKTRNVCWEEFRYRHWMHQ